MIPNFDLFSVFYLVICVFVVKYAYSLLFRPVNLSWKDVCTSRTNQNLKGPKMRFPNGWYVVAESRKVAKNQIIDSQCCGQDLVVWRGTSGKAYVADAYCPHMGAHLGFGGASEDEWISCPFHRWKFCGTNGACISVTNSKKVPENSSLKLHDAVENCGFIYVWYHSRNEKPSYFPEPVQEIIDGHYIYRGRSEFHINCNIQEVAENFGDACHVSEVHNASFLKGTALTGLDWLDKFVTEDWRTEFSVDKDISKKHLSHLKIQIKYYILKWHFEANGVGVMVGPAITRFNFELPIGKIMTFMALTPTMSTNSIRMVHLFYATRHLPLVLYKVVFFAEAVQIARDKNIWDRKRHPEKYLLVKEDSDLKSFKRWYSQFYSSASIAEAKSLDF